MTSVPPEPVLHAFGVAGERPTPLAGGQGQCWRAGHLVLKPCGAEVEATWRADLLAALQPELAHHELRLPVPARTSTGAWLADGWEASHWVEGTAQERRVRDIIAAGDRLHRLLCGVGRPLFLDARSHPWAVADRIAWGEATHGCLVRDPLLISLHAARREVHLPPQLVHGDLLGNVLFADGLPPAVIDLSPYWRPASYAAAIAAVDAVCWHGVPAAELLQLSEPARLSEPALCGTAWGNLLVHALIFRLATFHTMSAVPITLKQHVVEQHRACVDEALRLSGG